MLLTHCDGRMPRAVPQMSHSHNTAVTRRGPGPAVVSDAANAWRRTHRAHPGTARCFGSLGMVRGYSAAICEGGIAIAASNFLRIASAASRPSRMAQTTSDAPRTMSPMA